MSYNGSGTFNINTSGQPVVAGTVITATAFNLLTADLATGLTTAMTKDGQTTTTARIPFAQGISSTLVTDATNTTSGSIITAGGVGIAKALYVGTNANVAGTLDVTGTTTLTNPVINNIKMGYTTTATAAGTTTLTVSSNYRQFFTGTTTQTIVLPVTSTLVTGMAYEIENNSTGLLTVNSSGGNLVGTIPAGVCAHAVCIGTTLTTAADWDWDYISTTTITGTGANVLGTSPTITTPTISSLSSAAATALTLQSAGTTAVTIDTSQNVGIGTTSPTNRLSIVTASGSDGIVSVKSPTTETAGVLIDGGSSSNKGALLTFAKATTTKWRIGIDSAIGGGTSNNLNILGSSTDALLFGTNATEAMRIDSSGNLAVGTSSAFTSRLTVQQGGINDYIVRFNNTQASGIIYGPLSRFTGQTPNDTSSEFFACLDPGGYRMVVRSNGGIANYSANNVNLSDAREKTNIDLAGNYLDKICSISVKTFNYIDQNIEKDDGLTLGVIAQDVQAVAPELVMESNWAGKDEPEKMRLSIYQTDLQYALMKAIQELKAINDTQAETINALTARIVALENA